MQGSRKDIETGGAHLEDSRIPVVAPDEGDADYKRNFPWMKPIPAAPDNTIPRGPKRR